MNDLTKIETYKKVEIFYNKNNSKLHFKFEDLDFEVKYLFEAQEIIDKPKWEKCNLKGFIVCGYINKYIGKAKATRKDLKSGRPDWLAKEQYDIEYKRTDKKVYPDNKLNRAVYLEWQNQRDIYHQELCKLNDITTKLKRKS